MNYDCAQLKPVSCMFLCYVPRLHKRHLVWMVLIITVIKSVVCCQLQVKLIYGVLFIFTSSRSQV